VSVWFVIPSIRPRDEAVQVVSKWMGMGYKVAVQRDPGAEGIQTDMQSIRPYKGYAEAVNHMVERVLTEDPGAEWLVTGGDDIMPDPDHDPEDIARDCTAHFKGTLGVAQPTGDRFMTDAHGRCGAERVCISPWLGREWCERAYEGEGPLCEAYHHEFVDQDLHEVALRHGKLWHMPDITQFHAWYGRMGKPQPEHLKKVAARWDESKAVFDGRRAAGFPGSGFAP